MAGSSNRSWPEHPSPDPRVSGEKPRRRRPWPRHRFLTRHPTTIPSRKSWPCPFADLPATAPPQLAPGRPPPSATHGVRRRRTAEASTHPGLTVAEPTAPLSCRRLCPMQPVFIVSWLRSYDDTHQTTASPDSASRSSPRNRHRHQSTGSPRNMVTEVTEEH